MEAKVQKLNDLKKVEKVWGYEFWVQPDGGTDVGFCQKLLLFKPGSAGSLHRHNKKSESFFITQGFGRIEIGRGTDGTAVDSFPLEPGDFVTLPAGTWHKVYASADLPAPLVFIEASTPHSDEDVERLDESVEKYVEPSEE